MKETNNYSVVKILLRSTFVMAIGFALLTAVVAQSNRLKNQRRPNLNTPATAVERNNAADRTNPDVEQANQDRPKVIQPNVANPRLQVIILDQLLPRIDLNAEQKASFAQIRQQHIRKIRTLMDLERAQTRAYDESLFSAEFDTKNIERRAEQLAETRADMLKAQARFFIEVRQILSTEQFVKLRQIMEDERARRLNNVP